MTFAAAVKSGIGNFANFSGRASRSEFWWFILFSLGVVSVVALLDAIVIGLEKTSIFALLVGYIFVLPNFAVSVRRMHDSNLSGWWYWLVYLFPIGMFVQLYWMVRKGSAGVNRFDALQQEGAVCLPGIAKSLLALGLALPLVVFSNIYGMYWIPAGSMKPTLLVGDYLAVNKTAYGFSKIYCPRVMCGADHRAFTKQPKRGDVVVFKHPNSGADFIKRLVGLPGDRVQVKDGVLYINDKAVEVVPTGVFNETYGPQGPQGSTPRCENGRVSVGEICSKTRFRETLPGGVSHDILDIDKTGQADNTRVFTVPEGKFFFMGDNRDNSLDSRFAGPQGIGFVPFENLVGRAERIIFSSAGRAIAFFWTWRRGRFFEVVE